MDERFSYLPDIKQINQRASLTSEGGKYQELVEKWMERVVLNNRQAVDADPCASILECIIEQIIQAKNEQIWNKKLKDGAFAVFDLETTGLRPYQKDEIIAVGATFIDRMETGKINFYQLVNPGRSIPQKATEITGITEKDVEDKPEIEEVLKEFMELIEGRILVAHHAAFDLAFINLKLSKLTGGSIIIPTLDTALLARCLLPEIENFSLENLCQYFNIPVEERHHALGDAIMTAKLFISLVPLLEEDQRFTLSDIAQMYCSINGLPHYPLIF